MGQAAIPIVRVVSHPTFIKFAVGVAMVGAAVEASKSISKNISQNEDNCCCEGGRNILPRLHFIKKKSRKEAYEAARHYPGSNGVMYHPHNTSDNLPHFHPTYDYGGKRKIPGIHFQFPR